MGNNLSSKCPASRPEASRANRAPGRPRARASYTTDIPAAHRLVAEMPMNRKNRTRTLRERGRTAQGPRTYQHGNVIAKCLAEDS